MTIFQFEDKGLSQYAYTIMSDYKILVIDPARDPKTYFEYAMMHEAQLEGVLLTHSHADFVGSHFEISHVKRVPLYASSRLDAKFKYKPLEDGDTIPLGNITLEVLATPGHSFDSICLLAKDPDGKPHTLFSGDTLLLGDVGRPDLRENKDEEKSQRRELAQAMYQTIQEKIMPLPDEVQVYPGHGAGTLCGKGLSQAKCSTIGEQKRQNRALQPMSEEQFVDYLTSGQPFVPSYFSFAVELNKQGALELHEALRKVPRSAPDHSIDPKEIVIDTRPQTHFKKAHLPGAINIMNGIRFETWLGTIVAPDEHFYLIAEDEDELDEVIKRASHIGYEQFIKGALVHPEEGKVESSPALHLEHFRQNTDEFTILDIRNPDEKADEEIFPQSLHIPLPELRHRYGELPSDKPVVVHCAGGFRSAIGSSLLSRKLKNLSVYDLGEAVKEFSQTDQSLS